MGMKINKTNAARLLDRAHIAYELVPYEVDEEHLAAAHVAEQLNEDGWGASINKIIRVGSPNLYVGNWFVNRTVDLALIDDPIQTITFTRGRMYTPPIKHYIYDLTTNGNGFNKHTQYWNPWNRNLNKTVAHIVYNMR